MGEEQQRPGGRGSSRDKLIEAAATLVAEQGVQSLTMDAVAAAAGVTKGGLIYHFKTREDLLGALVSRMVGEIELRNRSHAPKDIEAGATRGLILSLVETTFDLPERDRKVFSNLLAAASAYPHLMKPAQALFSRLYEEIAGSGSKAGLALVLAAALDGISLLEFLGLHRFPEDQLATMRRTVAELASQLP
jgi:AcrR family transcriptional regulator